jgi:GDP/UDP-N,N'-diacetylbacillosamine 2-epimerase (hydrolysing)
MEGIRQTASLDLQIVATGMHLSPKFGLTYREIESDGFAIDAKIDMQLESDTPVGLARSMGLGLIGFGEVLERLKPDVMVVLGDRFEILPAVAAATVARIPVAHMHGGETTEGAVDEGIRHAITKLSHLHFVAAEEYRRRVVQMGEDPERVFVVGGLGVDSINKLPLLDRAQLESRLGCQLRPRNLLITFHPVTLEDATALGQMAELLAALESREDTLLIFTMPNADTGGPALIEMIKAFVASHANARAYTSLGQLVYLSCIRQVDAVVGNSSSGLTEAPSLKRGTINIGDRQRGRLKAESVIDCSPDHASISRALDRVYSPAFQSVLRSVRNPYGEGGASEEIVRVLKEYALESILKKSFYEIAPSQRSEVIAAT